MHKAVLHAAPGSGQSGWTLIEIIAACAVVGVLTAIAVPHFREASANARRADRLYALMRTLHGARSAAIMRAQPVVACASADGERCSPAGANWSEGWIVFANADRRMPPQPGPADTLLHREEAASPSSLRISANRAALVYWPVSLAGTTASIVLCDQRGSKEARAIVISHTGRPRISQRDSAGRLLRCA